MSSEMGPYQGVRIALSLTFLKLKLVNIRSGYLLIADPKKKNHPPKTTKPPSRAAWRFSGYGGRYWDRTSDPYRVKVVLSP